MSDTRDGVDAAARAEALIERGRHREAIDELQRALETASDHDVLLDLLAQAQLAVDPRAAAATAERLIALEPESYRGYLLASTAYGEFHTDFLSRPAKATRYARKAIALAPALPAPHARLAQTLVGQRIKYREAMREAQEAVALAPDETAGYLAAGNVELGYGAPRAARAWYLRALAIEPTDRDAQHNLALADQAAGRLASSATRAHAILRTDADDAGVRGLLDDVVYTALVNVQWIGLAVPFAGASARGAAIVLAPAAPFIAFAVFATLRLLVGFRRIRTLPWSYIVTLPRRRRRIGVITTTLIVSATATVVELVTARPASEYAAALAIATSFLGIASSWPNALRRRR